MTPNQRGSRSYLSAILLTLSGGYLDAYTYYVRGGVFANAQTGNIIKLGLTIAEGNTEQITYYLFPIIAFMSGVMASLIIENHFEKHRLHIPRRAVLLSEILMMIIISFLPQKKATNILANILVSLLCAMQMQSFQIFQSHSIATTVATGNLRKATEYLYLGIRSKNRSSIKYALLFYGIIVLFITGVMGGALISRYLGIHSILIPAFLLFINFLHITHVWKKTMHDAV